MDRLATRRDPLLRTESYLYDGNNNLTRFTDRRAQVTNYDPYDALNRRRTVTYQDSSTTNNTYDGGNRLTQINDSVAGLITRGYDDLNRLTSETTPQGSVTYTYDKASRRETMTVAGQPTVNYTYDDANRLTQITQGAATVVIGYDNANRRTSLTLPNGILVEYGYDNASRVTGITYKLGATTLGNLTYEYDKAGNRTKIGGTFARTGLPAALSSAVYDAANRLTQWGATALTYDNNGNLTNDGTNAYAWNARNQLASMTGASFVYDGLGRRQKKTIGASNTEFLYDGVNPVQETSGAAVLANTLTGLGIDEYFTRTDVVAGTTSHLLPDALGSTVALADSAGAVQTEYTYEPFGKTTVTGTPSSNPFQYTGRENDGTGLYYYRARYYHPEFQRFISEDPILVPFFPTQFGVCKYSSNLNWVVPLLVSTNPEMISSQFFNPYPYVQNTPTTIRDPLGLFGACEVVCAVSCAIGCTYFFKSPGPNVVCFLVCHLVCIGACPSPGEGASTLSPPPQPPFPNQPPPCFNGRKDCS